jgi:hypothetical protein
MQSIECEGVTLSLSHIRQSDRHASGSSGHRTGRLCQWSQDMQAKIHFFPEIYSNAVSRIRDVYPGPWIKNIPDPGSASALKNLSIFNPKNCL